jgi:formylglycine-generating enzyme required for sulfatase activity
VADSSTAEDTTADSSVVDSSPADTALPDSAVTDTAKPDAPSVDAPAGCTGLHGGAMVNVGTYCIDKYEVTNGDYNKFLDAPAAERTNVAGCDWNDGFETAVIDPALAKRPRTMVDWCDAAAYCQWAGKRLCGKLGGGSVAYVLFTDATKSEWMDACTAAGTQTYSYAGAYDATKCQTESGYGGILDVGSRPDCHSSMSPYDGVFDLTGNVEEWVDSCQLSPPLKTSYCHGPGGAAGDGEAKARCASTLTVAAANQKYDGLGFRCCKTP